MARQKRVDILGGLSYSTGSIAMVIAEEIIQLDVSRGPALARWIRSIDRAYSRGRGSEGVCHVPETRFDSGSGKEVRACR
jgi:hypothetical protein